MIDIMPWVTGPSGILFAESSEFRLFVEIPEELGGAVQFLVLRRGGRDIRDSLLGSGTRNDLQAAIDAAERMAERCASFSFAETALL